MLRRRLPHSRRSWLITTIIASILIAGASVGAVEVSKAQSGTVPGHAPLPAVLANAGVRDSGFAGSAIWALTTSKVELTVDGAHWNDVTPSNIDPTMIRGAYFTDPTHGWVAVSGPSASSGVVPLLVYRTADAGRSWQVSKVDASVLLGDSARAAARFAFVGNSDGWLEADMASSASFSDGNLYRTTDGGATWRSLHAPAAGAISFRTTSDGFLTGGVDGGELYATHDGGNSWQNVSLPGVTGSAGIISGPVFNGQDGAVTVSSSSGGEVAVDQTADGGQTWMPSVTLANPGSSAAVAPIASIGNGWLTTAGATVGFNQVPLRGGGTKPVQANGLPAPDLGSVVALRSAEGIPSTLAIDQGGVCEGFKTDCHEFGALFESNNGGSDWHQLTP